MPSCEMRLVLKQCSFWRMPFLMLPMTNIGLSKLVNWGCLGETPSLEPLSHSFMAVEAKVSSSLLLLSVLSLACLGFKSPAS